MEPPESFPNSEVKHVSADGSVGPPHARVGHRQAPITTKTPARKAGVFSYSQGGVLLSSRAEQVLKFVHVNSRTATLKCYG